MVPATRIDSLKAPTGFKINAENTRAVFAKRCFMSFFFGMRIAGNGRLVLALITLFFPSDAMM
jgi:hypothetical protein